MTLHEAAAKGIARVRLPHWADPGDYVKIDIIDGHLGPWGQLYAPVQALFDDMPRPQKFLVIGDTEDRYVAYEGPLLEAT